MGTALSLIVAGWMAPRFGWRACFYVLGVRRPGRGRGAGRSSASPHGWGLPAAGQPGRPCATSARCLGTLRTTPALWLVMLGGTLLVYGSGAALLAVTWLVQERGFLVPDGGLCGGRRRRRRRVRRQPVGWLVHRLVRTALDGRPALEPRPDDAGTLAVRRDVLHGAVELTAVLRVLVRRVGVDDGVVRPGVRGDSGVFAARRAIDDGRGGAAGDEPVRCRAQGRG